jgi:hypothetical protein
MYPARVSSKQTKTIFGLNRKEPKNNLIRLFFCLFHETKKLFFWFVSVNIGLTETPKLAVSVQKRNNRIVPKLVSKDNHNLTLAKYSLCP